MTPSYDSILIIIIGWKGEQWNFVVVIANSSTTRSSPATRAAAPDVLS